MEKQSKMISNVTNVMFIIEAVFAFLIIYSTIRKDTQNVPYMVQGAVILFFAYCVFILIFYEIGIR